MTKDSGQSEESKKCLAAQVRSAAAYYYRPNIDPLCRCLLSCAIVFIPALPEINRPYRRTLTYLL